MRNSLKAFPKALSGPVFRVDLPPRLLSGPLRQQSNVAMLRTIFPRRMFRIMSECSRKSSFSTRGALAGPRLAEMDVQNGEKNIMQAMLARSDIRCRRDVSLACVLRMVRRSTTHAGSDTGRDQGWKEIQDGGEGTCLSGPRICFISNLSMGA